LDIVNIGRRQRRACLRTMLCVLALCGMAAGHAQTQAVPGATPETTSPGAILLNHRHIVTLRATLLGRTPADRAAFGLAALQAALQKDGPAQVSVWLEGDTAGLKLDESIVFYLLPGDIEGIPGATLAASAEAVRSRLQAAVLEIREMSDPRRIAQGVGLSLAATLLAWLVLKIAFAARRRIIGRTEALVAKWRSSHDEKSVINTYADYARSTSQGASTFLAWMLVVMVFDLWMTFVLGQFAFTRPWAEMSTQWLVGMLEQFALAIAGAVPGLLSAALIFFIARLAARANTQFMARVESGDVHVGWLDRDTAGPTRRVGNFVIWMFALAMAYPYLPGANTEAFKGVSVLVGLMLSLGASSVVGQIISGLSLMYSRTLRAGEYVKIGDTEGTVSSVGMFATKINTGMGEEVSLPNAVVFSQPVRNLSRLVKEGQFLLHTAVTIGYATPWRQVHAMLLEAASRSPGIAQEPVPYVVQTALSDYYVEYRLCAQSDRRPEQRRMELMNHLHGHIQDVFNENNVQIMSPHYEADPPAPQVVPPDAWSPGIVTRAQAGSSSPP
jgi:small-conductance mechanosensitive channel